ncbi:DUF983 domain-containing protein [Pseudooceanicola sediminis]|uniref:DUF983 domain-containing protein n=1 Tax=Pseudooceanicola sediminis TaxID=2211117 RepID=A0A399J077_9RHOB|nr:DUF983 domain-containing protein [Pseudooceanicola sediminis]KAA2315009.1 DUF983 domain-containing protein [Puniceibacterium sp. HSS470]RII38823.1 DUF983 domain-containing protein [Pseudooceanicola sediminis]|tara:strand:- start:1822 stop:2196 length:375 start_codon:yes stop_codon:yes gene_type:complete
MTMATDIDDRALKPALLRGARGRCPRCGEGELFSKYLKIRSTCPHCALDLTHQRTDDGPAYITILIVGHVGVFLLTSLFHLMADRPLVLALSMSAVCLVLALLMLPRVKGGMVGLQWAKRMHGF